MPSSVGALGGRPRVFLTHTAAVASRPFVHSRSAWWMCPFDATVGLVNALPLLASGSFSFALVCAVCSHFLGYVQ